MTQQQFAVEAVKTSVGTVAVWETTRPPRGDALLKLADVAWERGQPRLADEFRWLFLDEVVPRLQVGGVNRQCTNGSGYVLVYYRNPKDVAGAVKILRRQANFLAQGVAQNERS